MLYSNFISISSNLIIISAEIKELLFEDLNYINYKEQCYRQKKDFIRKAMVEIIMLYLIIVIIMIVTAIITIAAVQTTNLIII